MEMPETFSSCFPLVFSATEAVAESVEEGRSPRN